MPNVKALITQFEQMRPDLHEDLQRFLDLVWSHRNDGDWLDLYGMYIGDPAKPFKQKPVSDGAETRAYLQRLTTVGKEPQIQADSEDLVIPIYYTLNSEGKYERRAKPLGLQDLLNITRDDPNAAILEPLATTFYHFRRNDSSPNERIYLNVEPTYRVEVITWIVKNMILAPMAYPGVFNAKVSGSREKNRNDQIVMYISNAQEVERTLTGLAKYQNYPASNRLYFRDQTTAMTRQVRQHGSLMLRGVSVGSEPAGIKKQVDQYGTYILPKSQSFGTYRESCILDALRATKKAGQGKPEFIKRVIGEFQIMGLDPRNPSIQLNRQALETAAAKNKKILERMTNKH